MSNYTKGYLNMMIGMAAMLGGGYDVTDPFAKFHTDKLCKNCGKENHRLNFDCCCKKCGLEYEEKERMKNKGEENE